MHYCACYLVLFLWHGVVKIKTSLIYVDCRNLDFGWSRVLGLNASGISLPKIVLSR